MRRRATIALLAALYTTPASAWVAPTPRVGRLRARASSPSDDGLEALRKAALVDRCRARGLPVSGTKKVLADRLRARDRSEDEDAAAAEASAVAPLAVAADAAPERPSLASPRPPPPLFDEAPPAPLDDGAEAARAPALPSLPSLADSAEARDPRLRDAAADKLLTDVAAAGGAVDPGVLAAARAALLSDGGASFRAVAGRRVTAAPHDEALAGAVALITGYLRAERALVARDSMRTVLRAATEGPSAFDAAFAALSRAGRLDDALDAYVDDLLGDVAGRDAERGDLPKVLKLVKDRVEAERRVAADADLRILAAALRCADDGAVAALLVRELGQSLEAATTFEAYVADAAAYLENAGARTPDDRARLERVAAIRSVVATLRADMPV